jgi:hypothetical protein
MSSAKPAMSVTIKGNGLMDAHHPCPGCSTASGKKVATMLQAKPDSYLFVQRGEGVQVLFFFLEDAPEHVRSGDVSLFLRNPYDLLV